MKTHFIDIFEGLKRSSWKIKLKGGMVFECGDDDKKFDTEILIYSTNERTIMLETHSNVFADYTSKSLIKEYNAINKQIEQSRFDFQFAVSLKIRCDKVNAPKG